MTNNLLILDNGAYTIKISTLNQNEIKHVPNCVTKAKSERRRMFIGDELEDCKDLSGLFYILPISKGYLVNYDVQRQIWDYIFKNKINFQDGFEKTLILTEPYFNFKSIQENLLEIMFEEYGFDRIFAANPSFFTMVKHFKGNIENACCLIVDSGHSFTHIIPYINGKKIKNATKRIDLGGKALTNYLKDVISYRQLHVLDETYVMNQCKEDCCYVSLDFFKDLSTCKQKKNCIKREYVLPDFVNFKRGFIKEKNLDKTIVDQQTIEMNNERIQTTEILFHPSDIGINQVGISHCIYNCIENLPDEFKPLLYENIILIGGNCCFPGFKERIYNDIRSLADTFYDVEVFLPENPINDPTEGALYLAKERHDLLKKLLLNKNEFHSIGIQNSTDKFDV